MRANDKIWTFKSEKITKHLIFQNKTFSLNKLNLKNNDPEDADERGGLTLDFGDKEGVELSLRT